MLHPRYLFGFLAALILFAAPPVRAQHDVDLTNERFAFSPELPYDDAIPSPASFLGYELGTEFTLYAHVVDYLRALDAASNRITMHTYGETYEGRPLVYLAITSPQNHQRIDQIKQANQQLAHPAALRAAARQRLLAEQPVTVSYSYNIHGNEASSTEAAMQVAYRLAAATDTATRQLLDATVFVMYPCINPDGRDRYVYWYKTSRRNVVATDPSDLAHDPSWPNGRTNHYLFDVNRDWVWTIHPESRGLIAAYQEWMPQVHVDYHEQGYNDNYFTVPGTTPRNQLLPDAYTAWADTFGTANTHAFDRHHISYATREAFDFFYPGYGSSYPSTMGAIGMLTEQGGIGAGRAVETNDGYVLTLRQRIFDHYTTSLATLRAAMRNRQQLLQYFVNAHAQSTNTLATRAYLLPNDDGQGYLYDVLRMLRRHGVQIERATEDFQAAAAMDYRTGERATRPFEAGTYLVRTTQPRHLFVNTIMQRRMAIEDSVMYDMSTWSAPLAYNLEAYSTTEMPEVSTTAVQQVPPQPAGVTQPDARYGYVISWNQRHAPRALSMLWDAGYRVRAMRKPFEIADRAFPRGSLIVLLGRNPDKMDTAAADMQRIAETAQVRIVGVNTGLTPSGIDLGSEEGRPLTQPKAAMLVGGPFDTYTTGQIWYLFDQETRLPVTRIRPGALAQLQGDGGRYGAANLNQYDVLILPGDGWGGDLSALLDSTSRQRIKDWVQRGGTLVATEGSALFLTADRSGFTDVGLVTDAPDSSAAAFYTPYAAREDSLALDRIPGTAFNGVLDTSNPLAYGMPDRLYSLKLNTDALQPSRALQTVGYYPRSSDDVLVAGYASRENIKRLTGNAFAGVVPMGEGAVVLLVDNTQYRMFWRGPSRLMQNAVMLLGGM